MARELSPLGLFLMVVGTACISSGFTELLGWARFKSSMLSIGAFLIILGATGVLWALTQAHERLKATTMEVLDKLPK